MNAFALQQIMKQFKAFMLELFHVKSVIINKNIVNIG